MAFLAGFFQLALPLVKAWLKQKLKYLAFYESKVRELDKAVKDLGIEGERVQHKVDEEENRYGREIDIDVKGWLDGVDRIISEYEIFNKDEDHEYARFSNGFLPKPGIRYRLSRRAGDLTGKVNGLLQTAKKDNFSHWVGPPSMDVAFSNVGYESFASRNETMEKIMAALEDSGVRMVGVHGLSGVGKTTLVKEIAKKAREAKMFNVVIMAKVKKNPDIRKIQGQMADILGMTLEEESEIGRAARIRKRLMNEKEKTLIILDDLWAKLDFNMLGIPFENDDFGQKNLQKGKSSVAHDMMEVDENDGASNMMTTNKFLGASSNMKTKNSLTRYQGCKILLVSETKQVLFSQMDGKGNSIFSVEVLKEKEAVMLFKKIAGLGDSKSEFEKLATQIANKCNGLPMAIVTTARALKNESLPVWEDAHRQLERQKFIGAPELTTKLSYELLENEELKYTFLLCARLAHDALIMDLVKYCIGLGFLQGVYTVREARARVQALVRRLKESSLLSDSYSSDRFNMEDIVRGAAFSIASKDKHVFMLTKGKLDEWPDEDQLERYTAISLQHCDITVKFPGSINCPRLRVFHVDNNNPNLEIPDSFFKEMRELRVLILTGINLSPLPSSIRCLTKLRMLCLERCKLGKKLYFIGELENLRILSLSGSYVEKLPDELKLLTKLQILDVSNCPKLKIIPSDVISSLTSLEELYMRNNSIQWKVEEHGSKMENACLSELRHSNQLTTLDIQIPNVAHLPKNLFFDKLDYYKIVIGDFNEYSVMDFKIPERHEASTFLALQLKDGFNIHSQKGIKMLFGTVENLFLGELSGVQDVFHELNMEGFLYLKHLTIASNSDIKSIIDSEDRQHPEKVFPKLESLCLYKVKNMEQICYNQLADASFRKLKIIRIKICGQLKNVMMFSMVRLLTALETIEVSECHLLKEIVVMETQSNTPQILFPELRFLVLQSLPKFVGFYSGNLSELFDKKVEVRKLERLELSSIEIQNIWSDQSLPSSYFQNLIHLDVNDCRNLTYLFSISMAKSLVNLQNLLVSECEKMENIFKQVGKDRIFPKLKNIRLSRMNRLVEIWPSQVPSDSFTKLETLTIEDCGTLDNVFPYHMVGRFQSLSSLRVTHCKLMEKIFYLKDDKKRDVQVASNLQNLHLEALPKLMYVWSEDSKVILKFENLQKIWVHKCPILENIFPVSVAKSLEKLEYLKVWDCGRLKEIVTMEEDRNTSSIRFDFPRLTSIMFWGLPKLKSFYRGEHSLSWSALNDLSVKFCDKLEPFKTVSADSQNKAVFLPKEVIYKLKSLEIVPRDEKWLWSSIGSYRMHKLEELGMSKLVDTEILYVFLHRNPNLKSLLLHHCTFAELVPPKRVDANENFGVVPKLKSLKLFKLHSLKNIGFERDTVLQRIESLILDECPCLITIVPSSVSFAYLTNLEVLNCNRLKNLMAPSTAKSLVQLTTMKVIRCDMMKEIVLEQGSEGKSAKVVFRQLKALELLTLKNLTSFSSSKSCAFEFPLLEKLVVSGCPNMQKFSDQVESTRSLQQIFLHPKEDQRWYWAGDLNATIQKIYENKLFWEGTDTYTVIDEPFDLRVLCREIGLRDNPFPSLKTLKLERCNSQSHAILSDILPFLKNLKELQVRDCSNIKAIFEMNDSHEIKETAFQLKKLTLDGLPNLMHVWDSNNCRGILSFQNLQHVRVTKCGNLKALFPPKLAQKLVRLETLDITNCEELLEVVGREDQEEAEAEATQEFLFPCLTSLNLFRLPQLTCFYPGRYALECPELNHLGVKFCSKLELFQREQEAHHEGQGGTSANRQTLFSAEKVISKLEAMTLNWKDTMMLHGQFVKDHILDKLSKLRLCFDDVNEEVPTLPLEFLEKAPDLKYLQVSHCRGLKEIFPSKTHEVAKDRLLGCLKTLCLVELMELKSIGLEFFWLTRSEKKKRLCEKLHHLIVIACPSLTKLIDSAVSFSSLKQLIIRGCDGLEYLFTSSTAKTLLLLEEMKIEKCKSMKAILEKEQDERTSESDEINFGRLSEITLDSLSSLVCFYSGNDTFQFPYLRKVIMLKCPVMETFSQGSLNAESFRGIQVSSDPNDDLLLCGDLNTTVMACLLIQKQQHLILGDYPMLQEIWLKKTPLPDNCFCNLKSLVVVDSEYLSDAILPSHILPFLINLEELKVQKCNSVKAIFDYSNMTNNQPALSLSLPLKKLTLEQLPMLKHIWNEDSKVSLSLPHLEEVLVEECESIQSLFPASVATDRLKILDVENCEGLLEIFAKDEAATEGEATRELTMFPSLTLLRLWELESLKCFHPRMHNHQEWPELKVLEVYHCPKLKVFTTEFPSCPDSHPEDQDCGPIEQQGFVSAEKVTPHLEQLSLNKEDTERIEQGQLHVNLQKIKFLKLQYFHDESDIFPFLSTVPLPSIEKLGLVDCTIKEIFPFQIPHNDCTKILSQITGLDLNYLPMLNSIGLEHSWVVPLLGNLESLDVLRCDLLENLVPQLSCVSFSHLTNLIIEDCGGLKYLFSSSTAKSLGPLNKMDISDCESIEEILAKEGDKPEEDEITFRQLKILSLENLPNLGSFYTGNSTLKFPSLEEVSFVECHSMKLFCHNYVVPKDLQVQLDGVCRVGDLDTATLPEFEEGSTDS